MRAQHRGVWTGEPRRGSDFPAGALTLEVNPEGSRIGFFAFESPATPSSGQAGYLCSLGGAPNCASPSGWLPGFRYSALEAQSRGDILTFSVLLDEPWQAWCALQRPTSVPSSEACTGDFSIEPPFDDRSVLPTGECRVSRLGQLSEIDCGRLATVLRAPCDCSARQCWASARNPVRIALTLSDTDVLSGALWYEGNQAARVDLRRSAR